MKITKTWTPADMKGAIAEFLKKYDAKKIDGRKDCVLFYRAMGEAILGSKDAKDDDKKELYEGICDDIEEYQSLAYFIEIRGGGPCTFMRMLPGNISSGTYEPPYEEFKDVKNNIFMEWTPETQEQIMRGDPNTDRQFFKGDLTVKGSLKLASKPRQWIYAFFDYIGREVD